MKIQKITALCLCAVFIVSFSVNAGDTQSWYCKRQKDHRRPELDPQMSFITENGGVFLGENPEDKVIYLTFDAGYENGNVARILDVLKKHEAEGAFFILENLVLRDTDLVCRMAKEGHLVCNHTAHHKDMTKLSDTEIASEIRALEEVYREKTGYEIARFYRPPEGKFDARSLAAVKEMGYLTVFWSLAYADWDNNKQPDRGYARNLLLDNTHNGAIILLHPTSETNADILDDLMTEWENEGYRFGSLTEFLAKD